MYDLSAMNSANLCLTRGAIRILRAVSCGKREIEDNLYGGVS